jgi:hypothetical protein
MTNFPTPQERWLEDQRALDAQDQWRDHSRILFRRPDGTLGQSAARVADPGAKLDDAAYDKLTYTERKQYAERMSRGGK